MQTSVGTVKSTGVKYYYKVARFWGGTRYSADFVLPVGAKETWHETLGAARKASEAAGTLQKVGQIVTQHADGSVSVR